MAVCPSCGAYLVPPYRFCPSCGKAVPDQLPYPPAYPPPTTYVPPKKDNTVMVIVVIVIVVIVLSVALPAILYVMVSGLIGNGPPITKPTVTLTVTKITGGVTILVAGIQPSVPPSDFKVNIMNATSLATGTPVAMPSASGSTVQVAVSGVTFTTRWNNVGGSGDVSQGDTFVVMYTAAVGTQWYFLLIWVADGSVLPTNAHWQT